MLENQMESDKMIEISEADFPELPEIAALEREIFPDAWSLKRRNGRLSYLLLRIRGR